MNSPRLKISVLLITVALLVRMTPENVVLASVAVDTEVQSRAKDIAEHAPWTMSRSRKNSAHPLGMQTLSVEKQENKASPDAPMVRVYQYHYRLSQARVVVVNTDSGAISHTVQINSIHLPLNNVEIRYASKLLEKQTTVIGMLRDEQIRRGNTPFTILSELDVKASIFEPLDNTHACHRQRCALMSLFDDTSTVFSTEPIVNLQTLQVLLLNEP